ncbi:MAG: NAD-dependent succinate-semialdehyde dehydrogenase [Candidatus Dojkabacteria bacterium]
MTLQSINPATEEVLAEYQEETSNDIAIRLSRAEEAYKVWRSVPVGERLQYIHEYTQKLRTSSDELARTISLEMGRVYSDAKAEVEKCISLCELYVHNAERMLQPEAVDLDGSKAYVRYDSLGLVLGVMPWNFPYWQTLRFAIPALITGNAVLVKLASNVQGCGQALEDVFIESGFQEGLYQNLGISASAVESIIRDPRIQGVSVTGGERAGSSVASVAGSEIKKTVLELGGSDPFIVFPDVDITSVAKEATQARLRNCGQSCNAAKRFIVHEDVYDEFVTQLIEQFEKITIGDPFAEGVDMGPLATSSAREDIERQVRDSIGNGAILRTGGGRVGNVGFFYQPTVFEVRETEVPVFSEEVFGPVAPVIRFRNEEEAVLLANSSRLGLGSSVWTKDRERIDRMIPLIEAGNVFVNQRVSSDIHLPFGGVKKSGYGRELGKYGLMEWVNVKSVKIAGV